MHDLFLNFSDIPKKGDEEGDEVEDSVFRLFEFLELETAKMLALTEDHKNTLLQYLVYAKSFEEGTVDYDMIYRTRYIM